MFALCDGKLSWDDIEIQNGLENLDEDVSMKLVQKDDYGFFYPQLSSFHQSYSEEKEEHRKFRECFLYHKEKKIATLIQNCYRNRCNYFFLEYKGETVLLFNPRHSVLTLINMKGETVATHKFYDLFILAVHQLTPKILNVHGWIWQPIKKAELILIDHFENDMNYASSTFDLLEVPIGECECCKGELEIIEKKRFNVQLIDRVAEELSIEDYLFHHREACKVKRDIRNVESNEKRRLKAKETSKIMCDQNSAIKAFFNREEHPFIKYSGDVCAMEELEFISCNGGISGVDFDDRFEKLIMDRGDNDLYHLILFTLWRDAVMSTTKLKELFYYDIRFHYIITFDKVIMEIKNEIKRGYFNDDNTMSEKATPFEISFRKL